MICLDSSFLVDYLEGVEATRSFLSDNEHRPFFAPTVVLYELYRGAARSSGPETVGDLAADLDWLQPLPFDEATAREAAHVEAELRADGRPVNLGDVLIAGVCRTNGATLVTRDGHFEHVEDLDVERY